MNPAVKKQARLIFNPCVFQGKRVTQDLWIMHGHNRQAKASQEIATEYPSAMDHVKREGSYYITNEHKWWDSERNYQKIIQAPMAAHLVFYKTQLEKVIIRILLFYSIQKSAFLSYVCLKNAYSLHWRSSSAIRGKWHILADLELLTIGRKRSKQLSHDIMDQEDPCVLYEIDALSSPLPESSAVPNRRAVKTDPEDSLRRRSRKNSAFSKDHEEEQAPEDSSCRLSF